MSFLGRCAASSSVTIEEQGCLRLLILLNMSESYRTYLKATRAHVAAKLHCIEMHSFRGCGCRQAHAQRPTSEFETHRRIYDPFSSYHARLRKLCASMFCGEDCVLVRRLSARHGHLLFALLRVPQARACKMMQTRDIQSHTCIYQLCHTVTHTVQKVGAILQ